MTEFAASGAEIVRSLDPSIFRTSEVVRVAPRIRAQRVARPLDFRAKWWAPWVLVLADVVALELSLVVGLGIGSIFAGTSGQVVLPGAYWVLAVAVLALPVRHLVDGLYPGYGLGPVERLRRRVCGVGMVLGALILWDWLIWDFASGGGAHLPRGMLFSALLCAMVACPLAEALARKLMVRWRFWGIPVVVVGAGRTGELVIRALKKDQGLGLVPIAVFDDDRAKWGRRVGGVPIVGSVARVKRYSERAQVALVAMPGVGRSRLTRLSARLPFPRVIMVPDLIGMSTMGIAACDLSGIVGVEVRRNLLVRRNLIIKRVLDYVLGVPLFLLSLPLLLVFALWIKAVSPGTPFFVQTRIGLGGKSIRVLKLRTMYLDAEQRLAAHLDQNPDARREWEQFFKLKDDPRILPGVGHLLRKTSLDELPQFWNVLLGQMSLVGPRPLPAYHEAQFRRDFCALRRGVLPGVTGMWQVCCRSEGGLELQQSFDTYYLRNWSMWLDIHLLARTVWAVVSRAGAY